MPGPAAKETWKRDGFHQVVNTHLVGCDKKRHKSSLETIQLQHLPFAGLIHILYLAQGRTDLHNPLTTLPTFISKAAPRPFSQCLHPTRPPHSLSSTKTARLPTPMVIHNQQRTHIHEQREPKSGTTASNKLSKTSSLAPRSTIQSSALFPVTCWVFLQTL